MLSYSPNKKYSSCESHEVLDVNWLKRQKMIPEEGQLSRRNILYWKSSQGRESSARILASFDKIFLFYRFANDSIQDEILLEWQAITLKHISTYRPWILCPKCGNRKAKLYLRNQYFRCKLCNGLVNRSSQKSKIDRYIGRARKILKDLGLIDGCNTLNTSRLYDEMRPKGMHKKTFEKLQDDYVMASKFFE